MTGASRTYEARVENRRGVIPHMLPEPGEATWVIHAKPLTRDNGDGSSTISIGFPVLVLTGWLADQESVAKRIAEILTESGL